ncbi:MAG TPA: DUF2206 domain-containing protein [Trebonia sp.]|jgi:uncharacterized membrane protein|nr:DUF2206 domain-containing protein [Trebonia sp.]
MQEPVPARRHRDRDDERYRPAPARRRHALAAPAAGLLLLAVLTPVHGSWAVQVLLVPLLLIVPGVILLRALRVSGESVAQNPIYVPAASVLVLMASGLAIDLIGPYAGIAAPLRTAPLLITLEVVCAALLACSRGAPPETQIPWDRLSRPARLAWPLLVPALSAAGALELNSGHSGHLAAIAVVVVIVLLVEGFLFAPWCDDSLLVVTVYAASLAMMWSFSLRGDLVYGFDITSEYYSMMQTVTSGIWHLSHVNDAYGAMLSLTVLPAELHALSGMPALYIFKVVYPVLGAFFPVAIFCLARRVLAGRWAFMAAALVVMQQTFFQQLPALARQEIATMLFAALIPAVLDRHRSRRTGWIFVGLLSMGVVVAHYSTAYAAIPLLAGAAVLQLVVSRFRPVPRVTGTVLVACALSVGGAAVWYGPLTHSSSNFSQFVQAVEGKGINLLPNQGANILATYLQGESEQQVTPAQYQKLISASYKANEPFIIPLPNASQKQYALQPASDPTPPVTWNLGATVLSTADLVIQQLLNVLAGIGALVLALRRKLPPAARQVGLMGLGGMAFLALIRVSGTIAQQYNPQRAFLQAMIVLAIGICWLFQRTGARWKPTRPAILTVGAAILALFMVGTSGLAGAFLGGGTAANLANSYDDYQEFVLSAPDLAGAAWVDKAAPPGQFIYADNYGKLRLNTVAGSGRSGVFDAITPETIDQHAWVYATTANVKDDIVRSLLGSTLGVYAFPSRFLTSNFNVVYTNGSSEVFHR